MLCDDVDGNVKVFALERTRGRQLLLLSEVTYV